MATSDVSGVTPRLLAIAQVVLPAALALLLFAGVHAVAVAIAVERVQHLRGGVSWGLTVELAFLAFACLVLLQGLIAWFWPARRAAAALLAWLLFAGGLTLLADPFGSWSHPYRFLLLQACAAVGFVVLLLGQGLRPQYRFHQGLD